MHLQVSQRVQSHPNHLSMFKRHNLTRIVASKISTDVSSNEEISLRGNYNRRHIIDEDEMPKLIHDIFGTADDWNKRTNQRSTTNSALTNSQFYNDGKLIEKKKTMT